ncbi:MAG: type II toxin-antitoxin system VapC family toxin [Planctomycetaceae bacterium]
MDAYERLVKLVLVLRRWQIVCWNSEAADEFARLQSAGIGIGTKDLRIAALALTQDALLLTRNARDFCRVPGLRFES